MREFLVEISRLEFLHGTEFKYKNVVSRKKVPAYSSYVKQVAIIHV
jgi:hypothetical protein